MSLFETNLSRAHSCALSVSIVCRQRERATERWQRFLSLIDLVVRHCSRWKVVSLCLPPSEIFDLGRSVGGHLSSLEILYISNLDSISLWPELGAFECAPKLHAVRLGLGVPAQRLKIPWNQIRVLYALVLEVNLAFAFLLFVYPSSITANP